MHFSCPCQLVFHPHKLSLHGRQLVVLGPELPAIIHRRRKSKDHKGAAWCQALFDNGRGTTTAEHGTRLNSKRSATPQNRTFQRPNERAYASFDASSASILRIVRAAAAPAAPSAAAAPTVRRICPTARLLWIKDFSSASARATFGQHFSPDTHHQTFTGTFNL